MTLCSIHLPSFIQWVPGHFLGGQWTQSLTMMPFEMKDIHKKKKKKNHFPNLEVIRFVTLFVVKESFPKYSSHLWLGLGLILACRVTIKKKQKNCVWEFYSLLTRTTLDSKLKHPWPCCIMCYVHIQTWVFMNMAADNINLLKYP